MQGADVVVVQPGLLPFQGLAGGVSQYVLSGYDIGQITPVPAAQASIAAGASLSWTPSGSAVLSMFRPWAAGSYPGALAVSPIAASTVVYAWGAPGTDVMDSAGHTPGE